MVSSANLRSFTELDFRRTVVGVQGEEQWGENSGLIVQVLDENFLSLISCCLSFLFSLFSNKGWDTLPDFCPNAAAVGYCCCCRLLLLLLQSKLMNLLLPVHMLIQCCEYIITSVLIEGGQLGSRNSHKDLFFNKTIIIET